MSDDPPDETRREGPARKAWMAPTVGADTVAPAPRETVPPALATSVFDPPEQRFVETAELGRGGMGRVVEAVDRALGRSVAIKQSLASASVDLARFEREVRITARLQHPSVIPILDVGRDPDGQPFYIMRKIEGEPLADRVAQAATVRDRLALVSSFLGAVDAAAYAHAKHVVHRDIKPWNILLGPFGETLLIDWGIARELDQLDEVELEAADTGVGLTRLGVAQGTPGFLAPEQARGEKVGPRADVYSLGATLYHLLTNQLPYGRISATEAIDLAAEGTPPDFAVISEEVPRELVAILTKAMAPAAEARYADAGELAADLRRFLAGQLVAAHAYSTRERLVRWVRRHRIAVTVGALALVTVAVVSTLSIRQVVEERDAAQAAEDAARAAEQTALDHADQNLIDRARALLSSDPTSAVALLRELRAESRYWSTAREITRGAVREGVERRVGTARDGIRGLAFAPDQRRLAWADPSTITVRELASGKVRSYPVAGREIWWWGDDTIARVGPDAIAVLDLPSGKVRKVELVAHAIASWGDRLAVLDAAGRIIALDHDLTSRALVDGGAGALSARGERLVAIGLARLWVFDAAGSRTWPVQGLISSVTISADGTRVAALGAGLIHEWTLGPTLAPPRAWQRTKEHGNNLQYVENRLFGWSGEGSGFVELAANTVPLWTVPERRPGRLLAHILPFAEGALLVTDHGALAIATPFGISELVHRKVMIVHATIDAAGTRVALGLLDGDVLVIDLAHALPRTIPVKPTTQLVAIVGDRAVVRDYRDSPVMREQGVTGMGIFDQRTRTLTPLRPTTDTVSATDHLVVGSGPGLYHVWNERGELIVELESSSMQVADGVMYWLDRDTKLWSRTLQPLGAPVLRGHYPALRASFEPVDGRRWLMLSSVFEGHPLGVVIDRGAQRAVELTEQGVVELSTGPGQHRPIGRLGGVWWTRGVDPETPDDRPIWRGTQRLTLDHAVDGWHLFPDRIWAFTQFGRQDRIALTELDPEGRTLRRLDLPSDSRPTRTRTSILITDFGNLVELTPSSEIRSHLLSPGRLDALLSTDDRTLLIGLASSSTGQKQLAYWTDPVPADPATLRAYVDRLTNARVVPNSSVLRFESD